MIIYEYLFPDKKRFYIEDDGGDCVIFKLEITNKDNNGYLLNCSTYLLKYSFQQIAEMFIREFQFRGYNAELLEKDFNKK